MVEISAELVRNLILSQFPQWADLPVYPVVPGGHDNRTFRLGDTMSVRLPSAEGYAPQVRKEAAWLPRLHPLLPLPVPKPIAMGSPGEGYPWEWSINSWLEGQPASRDHITDMQQFARDLAAFLRALQAIDASDGPAAGAHNNYRGGSLAVYDAETRHAIENTHAALQIDRAVLTAVWENALATAWTAAPVWVHGDVAIGNLLVDGGRLSAVIDFGSMGTGDPACDLVMAWTFFAGPSREAFAGALTFGPDVWDRAKGWALWKALITFDEYHSTNPVRAAEAGCIIGEIVSDS